MLTAKTKITDCRLEPSDDTKMLVTVHNSSPVATAKNVSAVAKVGGTCLNGIDLSPNDRTFGTIPPRGSVTKEFVLKTERASVAKYTVVFDLKYDYEVPTHECERAEFVVVCD